MWDDDMSPDDAAVEPIRQKIEAMAYILWKKDTDLPKEIEDIISEILQDIKELANL